MATVGNPAQRLSHDGHHRHFWVPTLTDPDTPTVAELSGTPAFDFSRYVAKGGVSGDSTQNRVDSSDVTEVFDAQQAGTWSESIDIEMYKQHPDDDAFDFWAHGDKGYWVNLWAADEDSPQDGDPCYVRFVEVFEPVPLPFATNEKQRFRLGLAVLETPIFDATVASS